MIPPEIMMELDREFVEPLKNYIANLETRVRILEQEVAALKEQSKISPTLLDDVKGLVRGKVGRTVDELRI